MTERFLLWLYLLTAAVSIHLWFRRRDVFPVSYLLALLVTAGASAAALFSPPAAEVGFWVGTVGFLLFLLLPVMLLRLGRAAARRRRFRAAARLVGAARRLLPARFLLPERDLYREAAKPDGRVDPDALARRLAAAAPPEVGVRGAPASHALAVACVLVFAATLIVGGPPDFPILLEAGANYGPGVAAGEYYRLFTAMFLHDGWLHLGMNVIALLLVGKWLEPHLRPAPTLVVFFLGGLAGGVASLAWFASQGVVRAAVGASGGAMALFGAALVVFLRLPPSPLRARRVSSLALMIGATVFLGLVEERIDNGAHLGGLVAGALLALLFSAPRRRPDRIATVLAMLLAAMTASAFVWMLASLR